MIHENFYKKYVAIRQEAIKVLNEAIRILKDKEVHWHSDFPYVSAQLSFCDGHLEAKVMAIKYPVSEHNGILIMPDEDHQYYEVGYNDIQFGDIDGILDMLPDLI